MVALMTVLDTTTSVYYKFMTQKNDTEDEKILQGISCDRRYCPNRATVQKIKYNRTKKSKPLVHVSSYSLSNRRTVINVKDTNGTLRYYVAMNYQCTGIRTYKISARSLRAGGAMVMMCIKIELNNIWMMCRWHSNALMRY
jgi:hypothetical protein